MRMYDLIERKKRGQRLEGEEIRQIIEGYCKKEIPDYQMSALLMAIWFNGMDEKELPRIWERFYRIRKQSGHEDERSLRSQSFTPWFRMHAPAPDSGRQY